MIRFLNFSRQKSKERKLGQTAGAFYRILNAVGRSCGKISMMSKPATTMFGKTVAGIGRYLGNNQMA